LDDRFSLLVADRDAEAADRIARSLRKIDPRYTIDVVTGGDACLALATSRRYDLILLDYNLPGVSGSVILEALAGQSDTTPIIVVTEEGSEEAAVDIFRRGGSDYLVKSPTLLNTLAVRVRENIEKSKAVRERRERERQIRELKTFNESIVANMPASLVVLDGAGRVLLANRTFCQGMGASREAIEGRPLSEWLPSQVLEHGGLLRALARVRETGAAATLHGLVDTSDPDHPRILRARITTLDDPGLSAAGGAGSNRRLLVILEDVSEKEELDQENRKTKEYLESLVESSIDAIITTDTRGRISFCSRAVESLLGYAPSEMVGRPVAGFYAKGLDEARYVMNALRRQKKLVSHETEFLSRDGRRVPVILSASLLRDHRGRVIGTVGISKDITERLKSEQEIGYLKEFNENILENIRSAIVVTDNDGRVVYSNRAASATLGHEPEEFRELDLGRIFGASEEGGPPLLRRTITEGTTFQGAETTAHRKDGKAIPIGLSTSVLLDAAGARLGAIAIFQDLTEIRALQQQLFQSEKMASIGQLAAGVAHEINNPMGFIHSNLARMAEYIGDISMAIREYERLRAAAGAGDTPALREARDRATKARDDADLQFVLEDFAKAIAESREGAERITHIVQNLREFSHTDPAERVPADVNKCIESTANIIVNMLRYKVDLVKEYGDIPQIRCFPMQLNQVFMNLLVNAYQAIEDRGVIRIRTRSAGDTIVIEISDTGKGIAPEHIDKIYDPFFTTKEVGVGTGLGLATSYNIIEKHGGRITARSRVGAGTTFTIELPID
jgi:two-component system NtrC family sensor kinase